MNTKLQSASKWTLGLVCSIFISLSAVAQNYVGFSKEYIIEAMQAHNSEVLGPVVSSATDSNYILYLAENKNRIVVYFFEKKEVPLPDGTKKEADICVKYFSKTMCPDYSKCPQLVGVIKTLESAFTNTGHHTWIDYTKAIPQEWVLVEEDHYFEVHVSEVKK